ncbi:MAG: anti-sigma factor family protein [Nodosilinea sp.]
MGFPPALRPELDVTKRDRFELLSAYLDGEVTPEERRLVTVWLNSDPATKCLYNRLINLRRGLREDPYSSPCDAEVTLEGVFQSLNRRLQMVSMAGLGVVVIGTLNVLSGSLSTSQPPWRWALAPNPESLSIALDQPAFPIPAVAVPVSDTLVQESGGLPVDSEL